MRDLEAFDNPYRGSYQPWDYLCYLYAAKADRDAERAWYEGTAEPGWEMFYTGVDARGFVIPTLLWYEMSLDPDSAGKCQRGCQGQHDAVEFHSLPRLGACPATLEA